MVIKKRMPLGKFAYESMANFQSDTENETLKLRICRISFMQEKSLESAERGICVALQIG